MIRWLIFAITLADCFALSEMLMAREMSRAEIRSMPIVQRPSRPGHFYGNTVRRNAHRRH